MKIKYTLIVVAIISLISCKPQIEDGFKTDKGEADFSKFISIGNSMTAGTADGALYKTSQENSFANLLANQLKEVGGGEFVLPKINSEIGVIDYKYILSSSLTPLKLSKGYLEGLDNVGYVVDNFGVPGALVGHLVTPNYGNPTGLDTTRGKTPTANPYFVRFAENTTTTVIDQAIKRNPTFFSLWIGNNDVLGYATSGGTGVITPQAMFDGALDAIVAKLKSTGAKGVIANIPSVTSAPFFTTVPNNVLTLTKDLADQLNAGIKQIEAGLFVSGITYSYNINFVEGNNRFLIEDATLQLPKGFQFRQIKENELLTLTTPRDSLKLGMGSFNTKINSFYPIPNKYVLDEKELSKIDDAVDKFNAKIKKVADENGWAYVDVNSEFNDIKDGVSIDGIKVDSKLVTGGIFSLDGIHPTPRGSAIIANFFIEAIMSKYKASISKVNINNYQGTIIP